MCQILNNKPHPPQPVVLHPPSALLCLPELLSQSLPDSSTQTPQMLKLLTSSFLPTLSSVFLTLPAARPRVRFQTHSKFDFQLLTLGHSLCCLTLSLFPQLHLVYVDLKPENLLVQADGKTIVLVDYDLCRSLIDPDSQLNPRRTAAAAPGVTTPLTPGVTPLTPSASAPATPAGGTPATPGPTGSGGSAPAQSGAAVTIMNGHHNSSPQQATSTAAVVQEGLGKLSLQNGDASSTNGHASATNSSSAPAPSTPGAPLPPHPSLSSPVPTPGSVTAMVNGSEEQGKGMRRSVTIPSFEATSMVIQVRQRGAEVVLGHNSRGCSAVSHSAGASHTAPNFLLCASTSLGLVASQAQAWDSVACLLCAHRASTLKARSSRTSGGHVS
jgi:hypothetical protein